MNKGLIGLEWHEGELLKLPHFHFGVNYPFRFWKCVILDINIKKRLMLSPIALTFGCCEEHNAV